MFIRHRGIADIVIKGNIPIEKIDTVNKEVILSLFITITNANFDAHAIIDAIKKMVRMRDALKAEYNVNVPLHDSATFTLSNEAQMLQKAQTIGVLSTVNEDIRSLREMIIYGVKGMAYVYHASQLGKEDMDCYKHTYEALALTLDDTADANALLAMTLKTGEHGVKAMALLDAANTERYGHPEITNVSIGVRNNPAILVSGHDLYDLEMLLEQTKGTGVDVYTHSEMLPAHAYPFFKKYDNFAGNYGNAWWEQVTEFKHFGGPILFTTNCIVPPKDEEVRRRIFTTGAAGFEGCTYIEEDANGKKDFSAIIELAKTLPAPKAIEEGSITIGFAHNQVISLLDKVVDAVKSGAIKKFFVMGGCDGRMKSREYYTEFAKRLPKDTVILTAGCAKYRYNKLPLGDIGGIPRVLDAGQCNDSYSLVLIALKLQEAFSLSSVNELPIAFNIAWYEQKAIIVLLALLSLGIKNIHIGPTAPAFLSPNNLALLQKEYGLQLMGTVEDDMQLFLAS